MESISKKPQLDSEISIKEKFKNLSPKQKKEYIWEYYKFHIIVTIFAIIAITSFIHTMVTKKDTYCNITYYNSYVDQNELYGLRDTLNDILLKDNEKEMILVNPIYTDSSAGYSITPSQELAVKIAAKEIDIAIVNEEYFNTQVSDDMFEDISKLNGFSSLNLSEDDIVKGKDSTGKEGIYGIKIDNMNLLKDLKYTSADNILTIIINSERKEQAMKILKVFTE